MTNDKLSRRRVLQATGVAATSGLIAGCSGDSGESESGGEETPTSEDESMETSTEAPTAASTEAETEASTEAPTSSDAGAPDEVSEYLSDVSNFDGSLTDMTGQSEATVEVGAEGNDGFYAFSPAALEVSTGTTVLFEWTGEGGAHNVIAEDETFDSGEAESGTGVMFEYTFDEAGTYNYNCTPHKALGMKGSIVVRS